MLLLIFHIELPHYDLHCLVYYFRVEFSAVGFVACNPRFHESYFYLILKMEVKERVNFLLLILQE